MCHKHLMVVVLDTFLSVNTKDVGKIIEYEFFHLYPKLGVSKLWLGPTSGLPKILSRSTCFLVRAFANVL